MTPTDLGFWVLVHLAINLNVGRLEPPYVCGPMGNTDHAYVLRADAPNGKPYAVICADLKAWFKGQADDLLLRPPLGPPLGYRKLVKALQRLEQHDLRGTQAGSITNAYMVRFSPRGNP